jgi:KOW motif.
MAKIKKGDQVIVRTGKDKGKTGRVSSILKNDKVLIEGINQVKKKSKT